MHLKSPAKINHFLHITGQRPDGYHELQTVFQFIDLCDELIFSLNPQGQISIDSNLAIDLEENLIFRAAKLLQAQTNTNLGVDIQLSKKIPTGGGLGGGSSNAATTLYALNQLWELKLKNSQLLQIAGKLGADVPIFLHGHAAWAEGVGEVFSPFSPFEEYIVLLSPKCHVPTKQLFSHPELTRNTPSCTIVALADGECNDDRLVGFKNDFEPVVVHEFPPVAEALEWLNQFGQARLSGSGGSVFAFFKEHEHAQSVVSKLPEHISGAVVKGCNTSPMLT